MGGRAWLAIGLIVAMVVLLVANSGCCSLALAVTTLSRSSRGGIAP